MIGGPFWCARSRSGVFRRIMANKIEAERDSSCWLHLSPDKKYIIPTALNSAGGLGNLHGLYRTLPHSNLRFEFRGIRRQFDWPPPPILQKNAFKHGGLCRPFMQTQVGMQDRNSDRLCSGFPWNTYLKPIRTTEFHYVDANLSLPSGQPKKQISIL